MLAKFKKIDGMENVMVILCVDGLQNLRTMAPKIVLSIMLYSTLWLLHFINSICNLCLLSNSWNAF